ncbi:hypothetical protein [Rhizobium sp. UGM030330-04]|uniref:hypothetical protein n=1 Tax=Rhizobium sp. UGM030330-04 TaxID=1378077 RepID=UPI0011B64806|nr:hypothetical protein [Rhizobium sp. UGM030330-04]
MAAGKLNEQNFIDFYHIFIQINESKKLEKSRIAANSANADEAPSMAGIMASHIGAISHREKRTLLSAAGH